VTTPGVLVATVIVVLSATGVGCLVAPDLVRGDGDLRDMFLKESPIVSWIDVHEKLWPHTYEPSMVSVTGVDFTSLETQHQLHKLKSALDGNKHLVATETQSWYHSFVKWSIKKKRATDTVGSSKEDEVSHWVVPKDKFMTTLNDYLASDDGKSQASFLDRTESGELQGCTFFFEASSSAVDVERVKIMVELRALRKSVPLPGEVFGANFLWADRDKKIWKITTNSLLQAGLAVIAILCLTLHPKVAALIGLNVLMIDVDIFGMMYAMDVRLGSISVLALTISIGLSVDYCAHIGIAFSFATGSRAHRVREALLEIGPSVLKGATSTLIGILSLYWARSFLFQSFFKVMVCAVLLGLTHALILFPVLLFYLGPGARGHAD